MATTIHKCTGLGQLLPTNQNLRADKQNGVCPLHYLMIPKILPRLTGSYLIRIGETLIRCIRKQSFRWSAFLSVLNIRRQK